MAHLKQMLTSRGFRMLMGLPLEPEVLSHKQQVTRLYRAALKQCLYWHEDRDDFLEEARVIRNRFDANKNVKDAAVIKQLLLDGQEELRAEEHPDPIRHLMLPGGAMFQRNPTLPRNTIEADPWGLYYQVPTFDPWKGLSHEPGHSPRAAGNHDDDHHHDDHHHDDHHGHSHGKDAHHH